MKQLLVLLVFCFGSIQLFGQRLVLYNKLTYEKTMIWLDQEIFIQTLDDPAGYMTRAIVHDIRDSVILLRKGKSVSAQVIEVPLSHISNIYLKGNFKSYFRNFWVVPGFLLVSTGVITSVFSPEIGPLFSLAGLPLLTYGAKVVPKQKWHLANCVIIVNR